MTTKERVLLSLRFFDLQRLAPTLLEVHKYIIADPEDLEKTSLPGTFELKSSTINSFEITDVYDVQSALEELVATGRVEQYQGFYCLSGKRDLINTRLRDYVYGVRREKRIKKFLQWTAYIPFIRGVAIGGSQTLGPQTNTSDIDLLVFTDDRFMWFGRFLITTFFHLFGVRRHHKKIADRFCLNHYVAGIKKLNWDLNIYTAFEYARLRPVVYPGVVRKFQRVNLAWTASALHNLPLYTYTTQPERGKWLQGIMEIILENTIGGVLNRWLARYQIARIKKDEYILVEHNELSFHHPGKQKQLIADFYRIITAEKPQVDTSV